MKLLTTLILIVLIVGLFLLVPLLLLWSLNTLFPVLAIPYTLKTVIAVLILAMLFSAPLAKD